MATKLSFEGNLCNIVSNGHKIAQAHRTDLLYVLHGTPCKPIVAHIVYSPSPYLNPNTTLTANVAKSEVSKASSIIWHRRLVHIDPKSIYKLDQKNMVEGMELTDRLKSDHSPCKACLEGNQTRQPISDKSRADNPRVLYRIHSDICGPMPTMS